MSLDLQILTILLMGLQETVFMVAFFSLLLYLISIPLGILLIVTDKDGIQSNGAINIVLGIIISLMRSAPFIIMLLTVLSFTRFTVRTMLGLKVVVVSLALVAASYIARMVESSLKEVGARVVETAKSMGASNFQIVRKVMLSETRPPLLIGAVIFIMTILGYSTMAGFVGDRGLSTFAINYGYYRYQIDAMLAIVVVLVIIVQLIQESFPWMARHVDKCTRWRNSLLSRRLQAIKQNKDSGR